MFQPPYPRESCQVEPWVFPTPVLLCCKQNSQHLCQKLNLACLTTLSRITLEASVNRKSLSYRLCLKILFISLLFKTVSHSYNDRISSLSPVRGKVLPVLNHCIMIMCEVISQC